MLAGLMQQQRGHPHIAPVEIKGCPSQKVAAIFMPAREFRSAPSGPFFLRQMTRRFEAQSFRLIQRYSFFRDRDEMGHGIDERAIDPVEAFHRHPDRQGDFSMFPCAAQSVAHQSPILITAREAHMVDDQHQTKRLARRNVLPRLLGVRAVQNDCQYTPLAILLRQSAFAAFREGLEDHPCHLLKLMLDRGWKLAEVGAQCHDAIVACWWPPCARRA
ncbi:hypothetical protein [Sphingobium scionense]